MNESIEVSGFGNCFSETECARDSHLDKPTRRASRATFAVARLRPWQRSKLSDTASRPVSVSSSWPHVGKDHHCRPSSRNHGSPPHRLFRRNPRPMTKNRPRRMSRRRPQCPASNSSGSRWFCMSCFPLKATLPAFQKRIPSCVLSLFVVVVLNEGAMVAGF